MPALRNSYLDCHLVNLDAVGKLQGPYVVTQKASAPTDELAVEILFLLRRDGVWVDEVCLSTLPDHQRFLVFFDSAWETASCLESLSGEPKVIPRLVTAQELQTPAGDYRPDMLITQLQALAARYRFWKQQGSPSRE